VYKISAKTESENVFLRHLESDPRYDFWSRINKVGKPVTVMASPEVQNELEQYLLSHKIDHSLEIDNVQR
jgi:hypothetical protein